MNKSELEQRISELENELSNLRRIQNSHDQDSLNQKENLFAQSFLNNIIENSPNPMWISDAHGTLIRINQALRDILHLKDNEVIGKYNVFKDNILESQGVMPQVKEVFEKGKTAHFTILYDTSIVEGITLENTVKLFLHINISPIFDDNGRVTNAIIQHIDITKRKEAEDALAESEEKYRRALIEANRFAEIMDNIPTYIYIKNLKHEYVYANQLTLNLFKSSKECLPHNFDPEFFPKQTVETLWAIDNHIFTTGATTNNEVESIDHNNEKSIFWEKKYP